MTEQTYELTHEEQMQVANTIARQMGGVSRIRIMTGAKNFVAMDTENLGGLQFSFPRIKSKNGYVNKCRIKLNASDLYDFELWYIGKHGATLQYSETGLYDDMLIREFETETGLRLQL